MVLAANLIAHLIREANRICTLRLGADQHARCRGEADQRVRGDRPEAAVHPVVMAAMLIANLKGAVIRIRTPGLKADQHAVLQRGG